MTEPSRPGRSGVSRSGVKIGVTPDLVTNEAVRHFHGFWLSRCQDGRLPTKAAMDPVEMRAYLGGLILTKVHYDPLDFEYRIIGEEVIARLGNVTGKRVGKTALANVSDSAYRNYCLVVETRQPQFLEGMTLTAFRKDRPYPLSRVHCPLCSDGETIDHILTYVSFR